METREPAVAYGKKKFSEEEYLEMERLPQKGMNIIKGKYLTCMGMAICSLCLGPVTGII